MENELKKEDLKMENDVNFALEVEALQGKIAYVYKTMQKDKKKAIKKAEQFFDLLIYMFVAGFAGFLLGVIFS
jgi:hypothetical protein